MRRKEARATVEPRAKIDRTRVPRHIAIIMDGNRRWAMAHKVQIILGHRQGAASSKQIIRACTDLGVEVLTLYTFSTENWKRPAAEVAALMNLIEQNLRNELDELHANNVRVRHVGIRERVPESLLAELDRSTAHTAGNTGMILNLAINYGGRNEIVSAAREAARRVQDGAISIADITEDYFNELLFTRGNPDPDLMIRTGGEMRTSNFLPWQLAYAELWVTDKLWPEFTVADLEQAIADYQKRDRRFGGVKNGV